MATTTPPANSARLTLLCGCLALLFSPLAAAAKNWNITPSLGVSTTYTSNLNLSPDNEVSSSILDITPGVTLNRRGARASVALDYSAHLLRYSSGARNDRVDHRLNAALESELVEDHLFLQSSATYSQQLIDRRSATIGSIVNAPGNFTDTATFSISPIWRQRIGRYTELGAQASYDAVLFSDAQDDSEGTAYQLFVDTRNNPSKLSWRLSAGQSQAQPDQSDDIREDSVSATLSYRYSPQLIPRLSAGWVDNHLDLPNDDRASAGSFWGAGLLWQPNPRNSLDLSYNSRLQTNQSYGLNFQHRRKHSNWSLSYQEGISSVRQQLLSNLAIGALVCPPGNFTLDQCSFVIGGGPLTAPPGSQIFSVNVPIASLVNDRFIQRTTRANLVAGKGKSLINGGLFYSEREFQLVDNSEIEQGVEVGWSWRTSRLGRFNLGWRWTMLEGTAQPNDYSSASNVAYTRNLSPKTALSGSLRYTERHSPDAARQFEDWTAVLSLTKFF